MNIIEDPEILEAEKAKPSDKPDYWAKRSCNDCYGRGVIGKVATKVETNTIVQNIVCHCAKRNFTKWRDDWVKIQKTRKSMVENSIKVVQEAVQAKNESVVNSIIPESSTIVDKAP